MLNNVKIGPKLISGFVLVAVIAAVIGIVGAKNIRTIDAADTKLFMMVAKPLEEIGAIANNFQRVRVNTRDLILAETPDEINKYGVRIQELRDSIDMYATEFEKSLISEEAKKTFAEFMIARKEYGSHLDELIALAKTNNDAAAFTYLKGDMNTASRTEQNLIGNLMEIKVKSGQEISEENTKLANAAVMTMTILIIGGAILALVIGIFLTLSITKPLNQGVTMMQEMSLGHLGIRLKMDRKDEIGLLANAMDVFSEDLQKQVVGTLQKISAGDVSTDVKAKDAQDEISPALINTTESLRGLIAEAGMLRKAAIEGRLSTRGSADKFKGGYKDIVQGVNDTLDAVINPLNVTAKYVDDISKGVIPPIITDNYNGDFNIIKGNLNNVVKMMSDLLKETDIIIKAAADGELSKRADATKFVGGWNQLVSGVNDTITNIVNPLMVTADYVDKVSKGVIPPEITDVYKGQYNVIKGNLNNVVKMMSDLLKETDIIIKAAADGELNKRADATKFVGGWNQLVAGVNDTITNIVNPLMVTADYVDKVSKGVIPPEITDVYKGQYNIIKNNLNNVVKMMSELLQETDKLVKAALAGQLETRANAALFVGGWNQLVSGVNNTLEAVLGPINEAATVLDKVSARDMTARVKGDYKGDLAKIKNSLNLAVENLDTALGQVSGATSQVASASNQISAGSQSLAQGANEQASSLEEISSSLEEMASMTKQNAENSNQAKSLAGEADSNAKIGTEAMARMSSAINKIKESSDQTAKIVKTIDEIAMQTNLLALNAAVEAARAGEAGRGFAVVAEEVRNLAQRSAQAAKNTADMIGESVQNAEVGVKIATEVSKSFDSIAGSAKKVNDLIAEIAAASREQSQGIEQVNTAVTQMDKVTQQNAANSEESASAAEELSSQAEELQNMVAQFSISSRGDRVAMTSPAHTLRPAIAAPDHKAKQQQQTHRKLSPSQPRKVNAEDIIPMNEEALKEF